MGFDLCFLKDPKGNIVTRSNGVKILKTHEVRKREREKILARQKANLQTYLPADITPGIQAKPEPPTHLSVDIVREVRKLRKTKEETKSSWSMSIRSFLTSILE